MPMLNDGVHWDKDGMPFHVNANPDCGKCGGYGVVDLRQLPHTDVLFAYCPQCVAVERVPDRELGVGDA